MRRTVLFVPIATLVAIHAAHAQAGRITGTVTSAEGARPVVGAQVVVAGTTNGAVTRDDGRYTITVQPGTYTVRAIRLGFSPDSVTGVVVTAGGEATANFSLQASATMLGNIVVVGYGTQEQRDPGAYTDWFSKGPVELAAERRLAMPAHGYRILVR